MALVVQERELRNALGRLAKPPALVVTDSQAFLKVAADVPRGVPMTSFSILMSRFQGDLPEQVRGTLGIERLKGGDRVLVAESCSHHPIGEDIGRVKIPRWLTQYVGARLEFAHVQGRDFPADPSAYRLVVHCGNCMGNRREMLSRIHAMPRGRRADHQLRADHRVFAGHLRAGARSRSPPPWRRSVPLALETLDHAALVDLASRNRPGRARGVVAACRRRPRGARGRRGAPARAHRDQQPLRALLSLLRHPRLRARHDALPDDGRRDPRPAPARRRASATAPW